MKKLCCLFLSISSLFFTFSCAPSKDILKPTGDIVKIMSLKGKTYEGELLCIQENLFYLVSGNRIHTIQLNSTKTLLVTGYANRDWIVSLLLFQGIPTVLLAVAGSSVDSDNAGPIIAAGGVATVLVGLIFEVSTPRAPYVQAPFLDKDLKDVRKYSRFPQGLKKDQIQNLMLIHRQTEIVELQ